MPIPLTVTPGQVWTPTTRADDAALNATANPLVNLEPAGNIGPEYLNLPTVAAALSDSLRGRNLIAYNAFAWEHWKQPEGLACPAGILTENALSWSCKPTGGIVTVARVETAPNAASTWAAQLTGATGVTTTDYLTWIPSYVGSTLRAGTVWFSIYVFNPTAATIAVVPFLNTAGAVNARSTAGLTGSILGTSTPCPAGVWTRVQMSITAASYELPNGFEIGIRTAALTGPTVYLQVAQAQLEVATGGPTPWIPPFPMPDNLRNVPLLLDSERSLGGSALIILSDGQLRRLPPPAALLQPPVLGYNANAGIPEWIDADGSRQVFAYTGADEIFTVPAGVTEMEIHVWGAGAAHNNGRPGGVGGYSWAKFPAVAGDKYTAMVGQAGDYIDGAVATRYGFTGGITAGGLSGVFKLDTAILVTDTARAILVAGGGGAVSYDYHLPGSTATAGGNGNDATSSGSEATMRGIAPNFTIGQNDGGGGYAGGSAIGLAGRGGLGYRHTSGAGRPIATAGAIVGTPRTTPVVDGQVLIVPGSTSPYYRDQAGQTGKPGLIVVIWNP